VVAPSPLAEFAPAARYLIQYPYGCAEQTMGAFLATAAASTIGGAEARSWPELHRGGDRTARIDADGIGRIALWEGGRHPRVGQRLRGHVLLTIRPGHEVLLDDISRTCSPI